MSDELFDAVTRANDDEAVAAIVVTGAGRGFCAGADIEAVFKAQTDGADLAGSTEGAENWVALVRRSKPMLAAINGPAVGIGLTQVLPMDQLIASSTRSCGGRSSSPPLTRWPAPWARTHAPPCA